MIGFAYADLQRILTILITKTGGKTMKTKSLQKNIELMAVNARNAVEEMACVSMSAVNNSLKKMAKLLSENRKILEKENNKDLIAAQKKGLSDAMIDRLRLSDKTLGSMIKGLKEVARIKSPVGMVFDKRIRPNGLCIYKIKMPIGVIGIIYESRPNVTVDAAAICLKSKNASILRGGSESFNTNKILASIFCKALISAGLPSKAIQLVQTTDRMAVKYLLKQTENIDLIIPRGGENLIKTVVEESHIPVIKHYKGVCHIFVSRYAQMKKAIPIIVNAKVQRPGVCNAMETLLIDKKIPVSDKKAILTKLMENGVILLGDTHIRSLNNKIKAAKISDWYTEYLDLRLSVKSVKNIDEAIHHINTYGSHHTESILTESKKEIKKFLERVDSSSLMVNASTRFSDGGEYGMGCEIGISTDKLHARGPMGVEDLTTYKWIVEGNGQIRT